MYEYRCILDHVIDGNTILADIDLGFNIIIKQKIRLFGVAAPALHVNDGTEPSSGLTAQRRLASLLPKEFKVRTVLNKRGKYGRVLGYLYVTDGTTLKDVCVNDILIQEGLATVHESQTK